MLSHRQRSQVSYRVPPGFVVPQEVLMQPEKYGNNLLEAYNKITWGIEQKGIVWVRSDFTVDAPGLLHSEPTLFVPAHESNLDRFVAGLESVRDDYLKKQEQAERFAIASGAPVKMNALVNVGVDCYEHEAYRRDGDLEGRTGAGTFTFYASRKRKSDNIHIQAALGLGTYITAPTDEHNERDVFVCVLDPESLEFVYSLFLEGFDRGMSDRAYIQEYMHAMDASNGRVEEIEADFILKSILVPMVGGQVFSSTDITATLPSFEIGQLINELGIGTEIETAWTCPEEDDRGYVDPKKGCLWAYQLNRYSFDETEDVSFSAARDEDVLLESKTLIRRACTYEGPIIELDVYSRFSQGTIDRACSAHGKDKVCVAIYDGSVVYDVSRLQNIEGIVMLGTTDYSKWKGHFLSFVDKMVENGMIDFAVDVANKEFADGLTFDEKVLVECIGAKARISRISC